MVGIHVSNDNFDDNLNLGIAHEKVFIPFSNDGKTVYFDSRVPTQPETTKCSEFFMTSDTEWNPPSV